MPEVSTRKSRFAGPSCKSILYCNPEQPPPTTDTRNTPVARHCFCSNVDTRLAELGVTLIKRSSLTRKLGCEVGVMTGFAITRRINCLFCVASSEERVFRWWQGILRVLLRRLFFGASASLAAQQRSPTMVGRAELPLRSILN